MKPRYFLFIFLFAVIFSCSKDENDPIENDPSPGINELYSGQDITTNFFVRVTNEDGASVPGVQVEIEGEQLATDQYGVVQFIEVSVDSKRAHIKATLMDYFEAYRNINPTEGVNYITFKMIPKVLVGTYNTNSGEIIAYDNVQIIFSAGDLRKDNGDSFSGSVNVFSSYIDPLANDFGQTVPGDLLGTAGDDISSLESFGMIGVELETELGEKLNLSEGQEAELLFPLPESLISNAPSSIPLWHYDTFENIWVKEGEAFLQGNSYEGSVSHFTWWNCDNPSSFVEIEFKLVHGEALLPLSNMNFALSLNGFTATGTTNSNGTFSGFVPKNTQLTLEVYGGCGEIINTVSIGPLSSNTILGNIEISDNSANFGIIGNVVDCDNMNISSGLAIISEVGGSINHFSNVNSEGVFNLVFPCINDDSEFDLTILNYEDGTSQQFGPFSYDQSQTNDLKTLVICESNNASNVNIIIDGMVYSTNDISILQDTVASGWLRISMKDLSTSLSVECLDVELLIQDYGTVGSITVFSPGLYTIGIWNFCDDNGLDDYYQILNAEGEVTQYSLDPGGQFIGHFSFDIYPFFGSPIFNAECSFAIDIP